MQGLDAYYTGLLAEHQRKLDAEAGQEEDEECELTDEDKAFIESYATCVAVGTRDDVRQFLYPSNQHEGMPHYIYESIEDAWLVWQDALTFAKEKTK